MKKIVLSIITILFAFNISIVNAAPTTLKDLKEELAKDIANKESLIKQQQAVQNNIKTVNLEISEINAAIEQSQKEIDASVLKIEELNIEIVEKNKEIESLLSFEQVSKGDNVYLEYIFGASSFTDFIYRSALVEQLTEYNDNLIDEMHALIEENKKLQEELKQKIKENEERTLKLEAKLREYNLSLSDLSEHQLDIEADIKARQAEVNYYATEYAKNGCPDTQDIYTCIGVPYANGLTRPLASATVTSEYGWRFHPTLNYYRMHNGIDLAVGMGNNIFASAAGIVSKITWKSSCGGNIVWIQHNIDGEKFRTVYQHLAEVKVSVGDVVTMTSVIGTVGGGGYTLKKNGGWDTCSTGAHLHFGVLKGWTGSNYENPRNYINFPSKGSRFTSRF